MCAWVADRYYIIYSICTREKDSCICMAYSLLSCQPTRKNRLTYFFWRLTADSSHPHHEDAPTAAAAGDPDSAHLSPLTSDFFAVIWRTTAKNTPTAPAPRGRTDGRRTAQQSTDSTTTPRTVPAKKSNFACIAGQARLTIPSKARYTLERYDLKEPWINDRGCINILHPERSCCTSLMISIIQLISISPNSPPLPSL